MPDATMVVGLEGYEKITKSIELFKKHI